jgi:hypothetical protein
MPGVSSRISASPAENPASRRRPAGIEPMWPALARGVVVLLSLATPFVVTLLSR